MEGVKEMVRRMNEGYRAWEVLKTVMSNRVLEINATKCPYEGVIQPVLRNDEGSECA